MIRQNTDEKVYEVQKKLYNYGFYGPLPHYSAAILTFLTKWAGGNIIFGVKAIIFLSAIMGGIFFYKLAKKISNNVVISLISNLSTVLILQGKIIEKINNLPS